MRNERPMNTQAPRYNFDRVVRMVLSGITLTVVILLLRYLSDVLLPFAAGVVLAYLLNPVVRFIERRTRRRGVSVGITIVGLGMIALAVVGALIPLVVTQGRRFINDLEKLQRDVNVSAPAESSGGVLEAQPSDPPSPTGSAVIEQVEKQGEGSTPVPGKSELGLSELSDAWKAYREDAATPRSERLRRFRETVSGTVVGLALEKGVGYVRSDAFNKQMIELAGRLAAGGWTVVTFVINAVLGLTALILVVVYVVFLLLDFPEYERTWKAFLPPAYREPIVDFLGQFNAAMRQYFRGQAVVSLLTGVLYAVGFTLMGLPLAVPFGLFIGLLCMVPYLQIVSIPPALLLAVIRSLENDSGMAMSVLAVLGIYVVVQVIQDTLITPRVMGGATGLRPVAIMLGVFIWGKLLGFLGLLLAIPLTCLGIAYYRRYVLMHSAETARVKADP